MRKMSSIQSLGEVKVRQIFHDFYDRVFSDVMIGFFFKGRSKSLLIEREVQFTLNPEKYAKEKLGRSMEEAHKNMTIMGGHFNRRQVILKEVLLKHQVPTDVIDLWLNHNESLRKEVMGNAKGDCL